MLRVMTTDRGITPRRTIRIPDDEWDAIRARADREGLTITDAIRQVMARWAKR